MNKGLKELFEFQSRFYTTKQAIITTINVRRFKVFNERIIVNTLY